MYRKMICITLTAWLVGLVVDANCGFQLLGILCLRMLFPLLAVGCCLLYAIQKQEKRC